MKKTILTLVGFVTLSLCTLNSQAQTYGQKKKQFETKMQQQLKDSLGLNDEQIKKIQSINTKYQGQFAEIAQNSSLAQDEKRKQSQEVYQKKRTELKEILPPQQITKMEKMERRTKEEIGL